MAFVSTDEAAMSSSSAMPPAWSTCFGSFGLDSNSPYHFCRGSKSSIPTFFSWAALGLLQGCHSRAVCRATRPSEQVTNGYRKHVPSFLWGGQWSKVILTGFVQKLFHWVNTNQARDGTNGLPHSHGVTRQHIEKQHQQMTNLGLLRDFGGVNSQDHEGHSER